MATAALNFLAALTPEQHEKTMYGFGEDERMNFNFVPIPGERKGLPIKEMTAAQRVLAHQLLQSVLSAEGYLKAASIRHVEHLLGQFENRRAYRDPENYFVTIFGDPSIKNNWGWRFEGHHLSLNFASVGNSIAVTPAFMGSNPGKIAEGPYAGLQVLHAEIEAAHKLMNALSTDQQTIATIADTAPREIITGNERFAVLDTFEGISYSQMDALQQMLLRDLVSAYLDVMDPSIAREQEARVAVAGWDALYFAWAGSTDLSIAHYFRLHGPTLLIEYDNTQSNANHPHSVWRDLTNDFGRDLLRHHYNQSEEDHGH